MCMKEKMLDEFSSLPKSFDLKSIKKKSICIRCKQVYKEEIPVVNGYATWKTYGMCERCRKELTRGLKQK